MGRILYLAMALALAAPTAAMADVDLATVTRDLSAQGFTKMSVTHTLLGRVRIVATSSDYQREIVLNANTGEILRDFWVRRSSNAGPAPRVEILDPSGATAPDASDGPTASTGGFSGSSGGFDDGGSDDVGDDSGDDHGGDD